MMRGPGGRNARFRALRPFPCTMPDILSTPFLIAAVVAAVAGMVRGFAGFGAAMVMTPVFSALYGPEVGIVLCMLLEIVVALPLLPRAVRHVDWRVIGLLLAAHRGGAARQLCPDPGGTAAHALGHFRDRAVGCRDAGQRLALQRRTA